MKMNIEILNILKENLTVKISFIFISIFPVILLTGSSIVNTSIIIMNIMFLIHIFNEKKFQIFNNDFFYILFALWIFFIINTLLNDDFESNYSRAFGFIRFILLIFLFSYFLSYKNFKFKKTILNIWTIIFIIVSLDLVFEFIFGFNTFGFESNYTGRLSGFMGDELKIGHWYLCFSLIVLSNNYNQNKKFFYILLFSIIVSFLIGERANFIRLFLAFILLMTITRRLSFKKFGVLFIIIGGIFFIVNNAKIGNMHIVKGRYIDTFTSKLKYRSVKEFNNNYNPYTPMYFNAYNIFKDNKLLGVGLGSYLEKSHEKFRKVKFINGYAISPNTHPHQYHFEILAVLGLPGYIFIFLFLLYFFYKSLRFYKKDKNPINLTSFLMIFVFSIPLLPTGSFFTTFGASIFWLNFSLMNLGNFKNINH